MRPGPVGVSLLASTLQQANEMELGQGLGLMKAAPSDRNAWQCRRLPRQQERRPGHIKSTLQPQHSIPFGRISLT